MINVLNFDDYFWRGVLGIGIINKLGMDELGDTIEVYIEQLNEKEQQREKMQLELNELSEKYKAAKTEDE